MTRRLILAVLSGIGVVGGLRLRRRFREDIDRAWRRLDSIDRRIVSTGLGPVEYCERPVDAKTNGAVRPPVLVSHGIFHG